MKECEHIKGMKCSGTRNDDVFGNCMECERCLEFKLEKTFSMIDKVGNMHCGFHNYTVKFCKTQCKIEECPGKAIIEMRKEIWKVISKISSASKNGGEKL